MADLTIDDHVSKALADPDLFIAARFFHQRSRAFKAAIKFAKKASFFLETEDAQYLAGFKKTAKDAKLAYNFLEEIKGAKGLIVFVSGRPEKINWRILNVIDCYSKAMALKNTKAYCHVVSDALFDSPYNPSRDESSALCPCRDLEGFLRLTRRAKHSLLDQVRAAAEEKKQALCPLFRAEDFKELLPEPPKYW